MAKPLTAEIQDEIVRRYREGEDPWTIAPLFGIHRNTIYTLLERRSVPLRRAKRSFLAEGQIEQIRQLYGQGCTFQEVAQKMGISWRTAQKYARRGGVAARPAGFQQGEGHHAWKGGRVRTDGGYVLVLVREDDPFYEMAQVKTTEARYCLEHRLVMARHLGRILRDDETVHHKDGNKENNDISNLQLRQGKHGKGAVAQCASCGSHDVVWVEIASPTKN